MPAPYRMEFRREAVALLKSSGKTVPQLAKELGSRRGRCVTGAARSTSTRAARGA
jgi:hypothetical protein